MKKFTRHLISSGGYYLVALQIGNVFNFLFNAFLGRELTFAQFGLVTLINTLWSLVMIFVGAAGSTMTYKTAFLAARDGKDAGIRFYKSTFRKALFITTAVSILWFLAVPFTSEFFDIDKWMPLYLFTPILFISVLTSINRGYLTGALMYKAYGTFLAIESFSKLGLAFLLVYLHLNPLVYLSIVIAELVDFAITMMYVRRKTKQASAVTNEKFPIGFFNAAFITKLSGTSFQILDVILAKHFLTPVIAGEYAFLSLVGKMVFFFGSMLSVFILPLISRDEGLKVDPHKTFSRLFWGSAILTLAVYVGIGPLGHFTMPILFGKKALAVIPYLTAYGFAIALFTLSNQIVSYRLARKSYIFPVASLLFSGLVFIGIMLFHRNIADIVSTVFVVSILSFVALFIMNMFDVQGRFLKRVFVDFLEVFISSEKKDTRSNIYKKRILIFNWRDTKHSYAGGAEVYIHEMAKRWVVQGNKVTIFCGNDGSLARHEVVDGVEIIRRGGFYFVYVWAFIYYMMRLRGKYDVIIDSENGIPFFTPLYAKEKVFCLMHHVHQDVFRESLIKPLAMFAQFLEKDLTPLVYREVKFITVSESTKKDMEAIGLGKKGIDIIHPGVNLEQLVPGEKSSHPTILYLGRLKFYKSIHILLQAVPDMVKQIPNIEVIIAGDGDELKNLKKLAKKLAITANVTFTGKVSEQKKVSLYQKAWIFVNPSMMEGWGITTIEANACGTPVIASDVPGLRDSVSNPISGYLVEYGNAPAFSERILSLLENKDILKTMSKNAQVWSKKFDWETNSRKFLSALNNAELPQDESIAKAFGRKNFAFSKESA